MRVIGRCAAVLVRRIRGRPGAAAAARGGSGSFRVSSGTGGDSAQVAAPEPLAKSPLKKKGDGRVSTVAPGLPGPSEAPSECYLLRFTSSWSISSDVVTVLAFAWNPR